MMKITVQQLKRQYSNFPDDVPLALPENSNFDKDPQHYLVFIPWDDHYLQFVPEKYRRFFQTILPQLHKRTTDVHTAICMQYLDELITQAQNQGKDANLNTVAYALMLHDIGWNQLTDQEIASSLGIKGLKLNEKAAGPKEKHAVIGADIAKKILVHNNNRLNLTKKQIDLICQAVRYHDHPHQFQQLYPQAAYEILILADLDHLWSYTHLDFWLDVIRKGVAPKKYAKNLEHDLDNYFVTDVGKQKAQSLLAQRLTELQ